MCWADRNVGLGRVFFVIIEYAKRIVVTLLLYLHNDTTLHTVQSKKENERKSIVQSTSKHLVTREKT